MITLSFILQSIRRDERTQERETTNQDKRQPGGETGPLDERGDEALGDDNKGEVDQEKGE